ncbi:BNR/Asp-box repeat protein [Geobacter sp. OR-1]|uniref:chitobiase/beta-hexosaminidase C-terminal domain-containing protein n=1 Tax=Geobacter sp. OR-1 TaxID=1266765 RepID=UPI00054295DB|nr:chitobiase/beta-hexosaminidase C-terminal domain-containing protein [Geobacter sp. OR-1]GAM11402.1 BNR/Asp-box repeat protein [Geobacter sp. OR-1]
MHISSIGPKFRLSILTIILTLFVCLNGGECIATEQWQTVGPNGKAVAVSPNFAIDRTVFAGSDSTGVLISTDGGTNWTVVNNGLGNLNIWAIAISPVYASDRTVFAATDSGVFRSTNGGESWSNVYDGLGNQPTRSLSLSPNYVNDRTIFAGTWGGGVYRSTNGGDSWSSFNGGITDPFIASLAVSPSYDSDRTVYAGTWTAGVFKSNDGGSNWNSVGITYPHTIHALAVSPGYATDQTIFVGIGGGGGIQKSSDGGLTWSPQNYGLSNLNILSMAISQGFADNPAPPGYPGNRTLFAGTLGGGLFKSVDGGANWSPINSGLTNLNVWSLALTPNYTADQTAYAGTDNGLFKASPVAAIPAISVSPPDRHFGDVMVSTSTAQLFVVSNSGEATLNVAAIGISGGTSEFFVDPVTCPSLTPVLAPRENCTVRVTFLPSSIGTITATMTLESNAANSPTVSIPLSGTGISGNYSLNISLSGTGSGSVSLSTGGSCTGNCVQTFAAGTEVTLTPTAGSGSSFNSWSGCDYLSGDSCTVTMSANRSVNAAFRSLSQSPYLWQGIGPYGGNIQTFAVSPANASDQTVFAGGQGGVFKSTDNGASWSPVNAGLTTLGINALAISPDYAIDQTIYAVSQGGGVFKSTNGGANWMENNSGMTNLFAMAVSVSPSYALDRTVLVATQNGIFRSTDAGAHWALAKADEYAMALAFSPAYANDRTIFAGTFSGVYKSTDSGASWFAVNNGITGTNGIYVLSLAVSPGYATDQTIYVGTDFNGLFKSVNGGASWSPANTGILGGYHGLGVASVTVAPGAPQTLYVGGYDQGLFKSTNGGTTWNAITNGISSFYVRAVAFLPGSNQSLFVATMDKGVYKSTTGATSFEQANFGISNVSISAVAISPNYSTDKTIHAGVSYGDGFKSSDDGATWSKINKSNITSMVNSPNYLSDQTVFAGSWDGVFKIVNGTVTSLPGSPRTRTLAVSPAFAQDRTIFSGSDFGFAKSTDGGTSWSATSSINGNQTIRTVAFSPDYASDRTIFAGTHAGVFRSSDGGASWNAANSGLTYLPVATFAVSPGYAADKTIFAGTCDSDPCTSGRGIFKSINGGLSWSPVNNGLFTQAINTLAISPNYADDQTIYAGTNNGGVFRSTDGGASWNIVNGGVSSNDTVTSLAISPNYTIDRTVFAGTMFGGIYKLTSIAPTLATLSIVKTGTGSGKITDSTGLIWWSGNNGASSYVAGMLVVLTATAHPDSSFNGWTGCDWVAGDQCTVSMSGPRNVTALFTYQGPTGSIRINSGYPATTSTTVTLQLSASDSNGISEMRFSTDNVSWSVPETYATSKSWTLTGGDGEKKVYVQYKNSLGSWSSSYVASIILDTVAPVTSASHPSGSYGTAFDVALTASDWSGTMVDLQSGIAAIYYTTDGSVPTTSSAVYTAPLTISSDTTLKFFAKDVAGNTESVKSIVYKLVSSGQITVNGTGNYGTIQSAIDAAPVGATINVPTGVYYESITLKKGITLQGANPWDTIIFAANNAYAAVNVVSDTATIKGFTISGEPLYSGQQRKGIEANMEAQVTAINNIIMNHNVGISSYNRSSIMVTNSVIANNTWGAVDIGMATVATLENNVIANNGFGWVDSYGSGANFVFRNNIIANNASYGFITMSSLFIEYNDVWNNSGGNYAFNTGYGVIPFSPAPGTGEQSTDPLFSSPVYYALSSGSPLRNAGNPSSAYNNTDGTRNDMGIYGGPGRMPTDYSTPPPMVTTLTGFDKPADNGGVIGLDWSRYPKPADFEQFRIYRSTESFADVAGMTPIATTSDTSFFDNTTLNETDYYYAVTGVDALGNENKNVIFAGPVRSVNNSVIPPVTTASPAGGVYLTAQSVTLTTSQPATVYYTTDGSIPTTASAIYAAPVNIAASTTLRFFAKDTFGNTESVKTENYAIAVPLQVAITGEGTGSVHTILAPDIQCLSGTCLQFYPPGSIVTLTATPAAGFAFSGWSGACTGTGICQVTMDAAKTVFATFARSSDTAPPTVSFTMPAAAGALTVPIVEFTATDDIGVTGYLVTESPLPPSGNDSGWSSSPPATHTFISPGNCYAYAWAKDAAGNISAPRAAVVNIAVNGSGDVLPPQILAFAVPSVSTLTVPIATLAVMDNIGVTGYIVSENSSPPSPTDPRWMSNVPTSFTFAAYGSKTLYAWARDAAGNISARISATCLVMDPTGTLDTVLTGWPAHPSTTSPSTFTFTSNSAAATFECSLDNQNYFPCASPISFGTLANGSHTFRVRAKDPASNYDVSPASYIWTVSVPIARSALNPYTTIANAYAVIGDGQNLEIKGIEFSESLLFDRAVAVTLKGGFDSVFLSNSGTTAIHGSIVISNGVVTIENITIM